MTPDPVRHSHPFALVGVIARSGKRPAIVRAGGRVGTYLAEAAAAVVDVQHRALGAACDTTAGALEEAAELLRWLAALTRACP